MYRFFPQVRRAIELLQSGCIGELLGVRANYGWILYDLEDPSARRTRATHDAGGGALHDVGSYCVDFVNWVLPHVEPTSIQGITRVWDQLDLSTTATLIYPGDLLPVYLINEDGVPTHETVVARDAFLPQFEHFAQVVRGQCAPHISPEASIQNARLIEAIRDSVVQVSII